MSIPPTERREFFRIKDHLFVEYRLVDADESKALEKSLKTSDSASEPMQQVEFRPSAGSLGRDDIYAYIETLDRKLNMIIDLLSRKDQVFRGVYSDVVLSGSGLRFTTDVKFDPGSVMEVRLVLPFLTKPRIAALARVVRCERRQTEGDDGWETSVSFVAIDEKDRDALVGYVFSRERETLRKGRRS